jgi:hypothetical protein
MSTSGLLARGAVYVGFCMVVLIVVASHLMDERGLLSFIKWTLITVSGGVLGWVWLLGMNFVATSLRHQPMAPEIEKAAALWLGGLSALLVRTALGKMAKPLA